jgi:hypothetical protein
MTHTMNLPARIWTAAVAYIALAIGAGLSIAGNVADTFRTRGANVDTLDIVMAVSWPALVVLMVEMFVSARWTGQGKAMQVLRWAGCLSIGAMAMRVSWVHLNDLMSSRGQAADVATLGPLAIDALAIMATALILSGRGQLAKPVDMAIPMTLDNSAGQWAGPVASVQDVAESEAAFRGLDNRPGPSAADIAEMDKATDGVSDAIEKAGQEFASEVDSFLANYMAGGSTETATPPVPVIRPSAPRRYGKITDIAAALALASKVGQEGGTQAEIEFALAAEHGVSTRTARRFLAVYRDGAEAESSD